MSIFDVFVNDLLKQVQRSGVDARLAGLTIGCVHVQMTSLCFPPLWQDIQSMLSECERLAQDSLLISITNFKQSLVSVQAKKSLSPNIPKFVMHGDEMTWLQLQ